MMYLSTKDDFNHIFNPNIFADINDPIQLTSTMEIELAGINIAAIIGLSSPCTANDNPTML